MADIIRMTRSELEVLASKFDNAATETEDLLNRLGAEVSNAAAGWEGDAYNAFVNKYDEIKTQMNSVVEMYRGVNDMVIAVADSIQQMDTELASKIGSNG